MAGASTEPVSTQLRAEWAIWKPYEDKGVGNGMYPSNTGDAVKIVLFANKLTEPMSTNAMPPHFSVNLDPGGKAWQHVDLYRPAYAISKGINDLTGKNANPNTGCGRTIEICLLAPTMWDKKYQDGKSNLWWTKDRMDTLAYYIGWLSIMDLNPGSKTSKISVNAPWAFDAYNLEPNRARRVWTPYQKTSGIMGMMHTPYNTGNWTPGSLDTNYLIKQVGNWRDLAPISAIDPETPAGQDIEQVGETVAGGGGDTAAEHVTTEVSMEGKAFKFNPPLHNHNIPHRVDFVAKDPTIKTYYQNEPAELPLGAEGVTAQTKLRVGRIIQFEMAAGLAALNDYRYGFRFLYNPTAVTVSASRNDSVYINPSSTTDAIISGINQNFQVISFKLMLNRQPDVLANPVSITDYIPNITEEDLQGLQKYGTHWDLMTLFRVCNGEWDMDDRGKTSDIGFLVPASARLILGQLNLFGFVESVNYTDRMFSKSMVPTLTDVDIVYRRHVDVQDIAAFGNLVGTTTKPGGSSTSSADNAQDSSLSDNMSGNNKDAPCPGYNRVRWGFGDGQGMYGGGKNAHTGDDYGYAPRGSPVHATRGGTVFYVGTSSNPGWGGDYGMHVIIQTGTVRHAYCHLEQNSPTVKTGQTVVMGDKLGTVGSTGRTEGAHLHYEERVDPYEYNIDARKPLWGAGVRE